MDFRSLIHGKDSLWNSQQKHVILIKWLQAKYWILSNKIHFLTKLITTMIGNQCLWIEFRNGIMLQRVSHNWMLGHWNNFKMWISTWVPITLALEVKDYKIFIIF